MLCGPSVAVLAGGDRRPAVVGGAPGAPRPRALAKTLPDWTPEGQAWVRAGAPSAQQGLLTGGPPTSACAVINKTDRWNSGVASSNRRRYDCATTGAVLVDATHPCAASHSAGS